MGDMPLFSRRAEVKEPPSSARLEDDARTIETAILRALADTGQKEVASLAGISETRLSRWKNSAADGGGLQLTEVAAALASMGLSVVGATPSELVTIPRVEYDALRVLASKGLAA